MGIMRSAARVTSAAEGLPRRRFTVAEVEAMVAAGVMEEDERVELIGGELVPMSPKGNQHEVVKVALLDRWYRARPDEVLLAPETTFRLNEDTYLEPDVVVYPSALEPKDLTGPIVLLVVEIAVRELWVIDAVKLTARVFQEPGADGYGEARDFSSTERIAPLFAPEAFALRLDEFRRKSALQDTGRPNP
jgi:Uma2 family endonuclease